MSNLQGKNSNAREKQLNDKISQRNSAASALSGDMIKMFDGFQSTLSDIQKRMINFEKAQSTVDDLKKDIYEQDGIEERLKIVCDETGANIEEIGDLRRENRTLRDEVDLLRNVVIRMDRRMDEIAKEVVHLRGRSMRDNILIHGYAQFPNEDLYRSVPDSIKKYFGVHVKFAVIHRNGKPRPNGKTVSITAKLMDRNQKDDILKAQKIKKNAGVNIPFYITAQEPLETAEERKRLYNVSDKFRQRGVNTKIVKNQLMMPNGQIYEDTVKPISNADILQISVMEQSTLDEIPTVSTECTEIRGNFLYATAGQVKSDTEVNDIYRKVCLFKDSASSNHRTLVYRYRKDNEDCDGYFDDGAHGVGRRILKYFKEHNITDTAIVITHWNGTNHLGYERFKIIERLVTDAVQMMVSNNSTDL